MSNVRKLTTDELPPNDNDLYTIQVTHKQELTSYDYTYNHKSWASVCGHLAHLQEEAEVALIFRERDGTLVLRYDVDGFDL